MAALILPITLILTAGKTFLVLDAVLWPESGSGVVARATNIIRHQLSQAPGKSTIASPRQQAMEPARASKVRSLRLRLLSMHVTSALSQGAGVAKYLLPASNTSCLVTHRTMVALLLLYDASLVLFLLAKVHVITKGDKFACWEKGTVWWARLYGWVFLPLAALVEASSAPGGANPEGTFCHNGVQEQGGSFVITVDEILFKLNKTVLAIQFTLMLGIFVKPLLVRVEGSQSGGGVNRRVALRSIICTAGMVVSYLLTTLIIYFSLSQGSPESSKSAQITDVTLAVNDLGTLCLTEIALPLGFTSCFSKCRREVSEVHSAALQTGEPPTKQHTAATVSKGNIIKILPLEDQLPGRP